MKVESPGEGWLADPGLRAQEGSRAPQGGGDPGTADARGALAPSLCGQGAVASPEDSVVGLAWADLPASAEAGASASGRDASSQASRSVEVATARARVRVTNLRDEPLFVTLRATVTTGRSDGREFSRSVDLGARASDDVVFDLSGLADTRMRFAGRLKVVAEVRLSSGEVVRHGLEPVFFEPSGQGVALYDRKALIRERRGGDLEGRLAAREADDDVGEIVTAHVVEARPKTPAERAADEARRGR